MIAALPGCFFLRGCAAPSDMPLLLDSEKRIVLYHGVNLCNYSKYAPDFLPWHTREDLAQLKDWGFNLVRYLVFWEAIEPEPGHYNEEYIKATLERIGWLEELGIDVLVDIHQDLYSRPFTGDGFPEWTIDADGYEFTPREPWNLNYAEPAVRAAYRNFWKSDYLRGKYIEMAAFLLARIENCPNVIGLDIMNEPWPAPILGFERKTLTPFYTAIQDMKRERRFTTPLFFEPVIYTSTGYPSRLRFAPDKGAVYSVHYYDPFCDERLPYTSFGKLLMRTGVHIKMKEARNFGVPLLYSEFGISSKVEGYDAFLEDILGLLRKHHISWTCYSFDKETDSGFSLLEQDGSPRESLLKHYMSVYPQRVAGRNLETVYEDDCFTLAYDPIDTEAPTVIAIPKRFSHATVTVNGVQIPFDPEQRRFEHPSAVTAGRQKIVVEW